MNNLRNFVNEMKNANLVIHVLEYKYNIKGHVFINIADSLFKKAKINNNYLISKLSFVKFKDGMIIDDLDCWVDEYRLFEPTIDGKTPLDNDKIREFFELSYAHNSGQLNKQLVEMLEQRIPLHFSLPSTQQIPLILKHMSSSNGSDGKDPKKIYLNHIKLLSEDKKRSEFMSQKAMLLNKSIYEKVKDDQQATFAYFKEPEMLKSEEEIIKEYLVKISNKKS